MWLWAGPAEDHLGIVFEAPEVEAGVGAVGGPGRATGFNLFGFEAELRRIEAAEAFLDSEIEGGEDIGASEIEHEDHLDGPEPDAFDGGEFADDLFI